jgi:hypothetical protein
MEWKNRKCKVPGLIVRWSTETANGTELWVEKRDGHYHWHFRPFVGGKAATTFATKEEAQQRCEKVAAKIEEFAGTAQALSQMVRFVVPDYNKVDESEDGEEYIYGSLEYVVKHLTCSLRDADFDPMMVHVTGNDSEGKAYDVPLELGFTFGIPTLKEEQ